jgi:hypothetical protein
MGLKKKKETESEFQVEKNNKTLWKGFMQAVHMNKTKCSELQ